MTVAKSFDLQGAIYSALSMVLTVPVYAHQPETPPVQFCRIDGFAMSADETYKNREQGTHTVTIHLIEGNTLSLQWVREAASAAHAVLGGLTLDDHSQPMRLVAAGASLDARSDAVRDAHAFLRYSVTIGD